jgi:type IV pilus assembly protein PilV
MKGIKYKRGFGLIEVLVTMVVLSTALLTLASLQARALQYNQGSYFRSQANLMGYDILDRIRVNKKYAADYVQTRVAFSSVVASPVSKNDVSLWLRDISTKLPDGYGAIACDQVARVCTVTIDWKELNASGNSDENRTTLSYSARL